MSPEQLLSTRDVDGRSNLWSLGVILYQLLTRELPFRGRGVPEIVAAVLEGRPPPPSFFQPGVPPELDAVVLRCLERDVGLRFADMGALALALAPFTPGSGPLVASIGRLAAAPAQSSAGLPVAVLSESQRLALTPRSLPSLRTSQSGAVPAAAATRQPPLLEPATLIAPGGVSGAWGGTKSGGARSRSVPVIAAVAAVAVGGLLAVGVSLGRATLAPGPASSGSPVPTVSMGAPAPKPPATPASSGNAGSRGERLRRSLRIPVRLRFESGPARGAQADPFGMERK